VLSLTNDLEVNVKIIYHCFGGTHSSITAAAIHLGWLPEKEAPPAYRFMELPYFDRRDGWDQGEIVFMGKDRQGNEVYAVGWGSASSMLTSLIDDLAGLFEIDRGSCRLVNVMKQVNLMMKIGGFMSRRLKAVRVGRPIVIYGARLAYRSIRSLVHKVQWEVGRPV
jgi:hypothetical protein